jgi:hypothetical protein
MSDKKVLGWLKGRAKENGMEVIDAACEWVKELLDENKRLRNVNEGLETAIADFMAHVEPMIQPWAKSAGHGRRVNGRLKYGDKISFAGSDDIQRKGIIIKHGHYSGYYICRDTEGKDHDVHVQEITWLSEIKSEAAE